jgi:predicted O-methyltransferase YrrM
MDMTAARWRSIEAYTAEVFGRQDDHMAGLMGAAVEHGLPDIAVNPATGRLLRMLASMTRGRLALEVGTLAGYSTIWIARGLRPGGRVITIEIDPIHAAFAARQFLSAHVADRIDQRLGAALQVLPDLRRELAPEGLDLVFLDAVKTEYPQYFQWVRPLLARGGLLIADNVFGSNDWHIEDETHPSRRAIDAFNRMVAADPELESIALPIGNGLLVARRQD